MLQDRWKKTTSPLALVVAAIVVLAGCGGGVQAGPAPAPTWSCTPDTSGEPCTPQKAAAQAEEAEAYEEAMHAYREFTKERNRLAMAGGTPTPTPEMSRLATGPYLEAITGFLASGHEAGRRASGPLAVTNVEPLSYAGDHVRLLVCEDGRGVDVFGPDGSVVSEGFLGALELRVERLPEGWKVADGMDTEVARCN